MKKIFLSVLTIVVAAIFFFQRKIESFNYKQSHYGLVNYDYGILSIEDLNQSDKGSFKATPFDGISMGYPYWQCFNKKYLKIKCNYIEPFDRSGSFLAIDIGTETENHFYSLSHAVSGEVCKGLLTEINKVLKGQEYFCINGIDGVLDSVTEKREYSWSFYRIKTKSGYAHYRFNEM